MTRKEKNNFTSALLKLLTEGENDRDFFLRLLEANKLIAFELQQFSDIFDEKEER